MKILQLFGVCLAMMVALVGCGPAKPMVGNWKIVPDESIAKEFPPEMMPSGVIHFKDDGTFVVSMKRGEVSTMSGTYTLVGRELTMTPKSSDGGPSTNVPEKATLEPDLTQFVIPGSDSKLKAVKL